MHKSGPGSPSKRDDRSKTSPDKMGEGALFLSDLQNNGLGPSMEEDCCQFLGWEVAQQFKVLPQVYLDLLVSFV